jgi:sugar phosphate permease
VLALQRRCWHDPINHGLADRDPAVFMPAFIIFLIGYVLSQFYRSFLAVIAPELSAELHLTPQDLGNILACWFAAFAVVQFPVGAALDKHGPRRTLAALALAGVAGAIVFATAHSAHQAMVAMALIGVGSSGALMGALFTFARTAPPHRFAMLSSLIIGLGGFGNLLGGTPLALAAQSFGWRSVFFGLAAIALLEALLVMLVIKDAKRIESPAQADDGSILHGLRDLVRLRSLWLLWPLMTVSYGVLITERGLWVGPYLSEVHGLDPIPRGNVIFIMAIAIALGALAYGPLETYLRRRKPLVLAGSLVAGACLLALAWLPAPTLLVCTILLSAFGFAGMTYGPLMAHVRLFLPDRLLGRGMTFANFLCMAGAGLLQVWSGSAVAQLKSGGTPLAEVYAAVHLALAAILIGGALIYAFSHEDPGRSR